MRRFCIFLLILLLIPSVMLTAKVSSTSLGGFYSYGNSIQSLSKDNMFGSSVGLALRSNTLFKRSGRLGLRYDLLAKRALDLTVDGTAAQELDTIGMDLGVGVAYQRPITYISYIEAGLGLRAAGGLVDYSYKGTTKVDNHALLGIAAFIDYYHALHNNVIINVGANAKMPLFGYAKSGDKNNPAEGMVSIGGIEVSPYVGVSYLF